MARRPQAVPSAIEPSFDPMKSSLDANNRLVEHWFEWQRGFWRSRLDLQSEWTGQWQEMASGLPYWPGAWRGGEQLA